MDLTVSLTIIFASPVKAINPTAFNEGGLQPRILIEFKSQFSLVQQLLCLKLRAQMMGRRRRYEDPGGIVGTSYKHIYSLTEAFS